ncbi:MAG TPA: efflux RND transporter periplasmic adaptor subunit [Candidatus Acidoferrales bacterium]|nr:efflux RND transporter periplasmic adaptor subunit [Candidatus Acidoferrales bacterium]
MNRTACILVAAALTFALMGCGNSTGAENPAPAHVASAPTTSAAPKPTLPAVASSPQPLDILSVLSVEHSVDVATQRDGVVIATEKDEGSPVRVGEEMGRLDDSMLQNEIEKAQSDLIVAQNNVKYKEAEEQAKAAQLHRQQLLRQSGLSSDADLEQAQFEDKAVQFEVDSWKSIVQSNEAQIRQLRLEIDKTHIRAPFSGVVVHRYIRQGQQVKTNDTCFRVSQLGPLEVEFQVPETSGMRPRPGVELAVRLTSDGAEVYAAHVLRVSPTVDAASDSYDVIAQLTGPNLSALRPGMSVHVLWPAASLAIR